MDLLYKQELHAGKSFIMRDLALLAGVVLLKKLKYFEFMLNIFEFSRVWENVES